MYSFFYATFVRKCLPRTKMECELSVCDSFLFWAVKNESSSLDLSKCFRARYAPPWKKYKHNNHFSFSTKPSSLTKSMVQNDLCINKHHLRRRTHDRHVNVLLQHKSENLTSPHISDAFFAMCPDYQWIQLFIHVADTAMVFVIYRSSEFLETWVKLV